MAYYMQKRGGEVQEACKNAYVINGRPLGCEVVLKNIFWDTILYDVSDSFV